MKRGYRSPRNVAWSAVERGAVLTPNMLNTLHPEIDEATAKQAFESLVKLGKVVRLDDDQYMARNVVHTGPR